MDLQLDSANFSKLPTDETAIRDLFVVSASVAHLVLDIFSIWPLCLLYFIVSQGVPLFMAPVPPNVQLQSPYSLFTDPTTGMFPIQTPCDATWGMIQDPYPPLQRAPHSSYVPPQITIASFDNSVRIFTLRSLSTPSY